MHLYCDESGNTGSHLLDPQQPVFALAATSLGTEAAKALVAPLLSASQTEAKYSVLRRSSRGQTALVALFESPLLTPEVASVVMTDKRYYLATQLVDKLIEPPLYEAGIDLYARDQAVNLARVWHYAGPHIFPNGGWERVLMALQEALKSRTPSTFEQFDATVRLSARDANPEMRDLVAGLLHAQGRLPEFLGIFTHASAFDPAVDSFILMISRIMETQPGRFAVTHDASKPLARQVDLLRALMKPDAATTTLGYSGRTMELPLRISSLQFADSRAHPQLQVADLIAGCAVDCLLAASGRRPMTKFHERVLSTGFNDLFVGGVLPKPQIQASSAPTSSEISLVDGAAQFLKRAGYFDSTGPST